MYFVLSGPFAAGVTVKDVDIRRMKKALNRLGYYQPPHDTGITGQADRSVFEGLKAFQRAQGIMPTGRAVPGDETTQRLNKSGKKPRKGYYIWRTMGDTRVRPSHAALNGTVRRWDDSPDPGEEINCRCWAEPLNIDDQPLENNRHDLLSLPRDTRWSLGRHKSAKTWEISLKIVTGPMKKLLKR